MINDKRPTGRGFGTPRLERPRYGDSRKVTDYAGLLTAFIISLVLLQGFVTYSVALTITQQRLQQIEALENE